MDNMGLGIILRGIIYYVCLRTVDNYKDIIYFSFCIHLFGIILGMIMTVNSRIKSDNKDLSRIYEDNATAGFTFVIYFGATRFLE